MDSMLRRSIENPLENSQLWDCPSVKPELVCKIDLYTKKEHDRWKSHQRQRKIKRKRECILSDSLS